MDEQIISVSYTHLEYLETALAAGETVGFEGRVVSVTEGEEYEKIASEKNGKVVYARCV